MADRVAGFTPDAAREIARFVREARRRQPGQRLDIGPLETVSDRVIRWARTTTNYYYPTYPSSGGVYVVEMGDYKPDTLVPGDTPDKTFTPYSPAWTEIAVDPSGATIAQGTVVRVELHDGQWWIRPTAAASGWSLYNLYGGFYSGTGSPADVATTADSADVFFEHGVGEQADVGIEVLCDGSSVSGDAILKITNPGFFLFQFSGTFEDASSGLPTTSTVTTGAASAGTPHTHDVDCPIRHFLLPYVSVRYRATGGGAWSTWSTKIGSELVNATFGSSNSYGTITFPWTMWGRSVGDEINLRVSVYSTASSGTRGLSCGMAELLVVRMSDAEPTTDAF